MPLRTALLALPLILAACSEAVVEPQGIVADDTLTQGGTVCPEAYRLSLADYFETGLPAPSDDFLEQNAERDGIVLADSGLQFRVVQEGLEDGVTPDLDQETEVHYHGYFPNGKVFDSSDERNQTVSFAPSRVIPGWTEALTGMKVCEARTLYVPYDLAYGVGGTQGIPPRSTLLFNVQVLSVQ